MGKNKEEIVRNLMNTNKKIDINVDFKIPLSKNTFNQKNHNYKCSCCGAGFVAQKRNFQQTNSPLFQANDGYLPWCKKCTDAFYKKLVELYSGNQIHAIEHFCQIADWVYEFNPLVVSESYDGWKDRSRISYYAAKKNLNVGNRQTYIDTLKNNYTTGLSNVITDIKQTKSDEVSISASAVERWGVGFSEQDYQTLDAHYKMLKKNNPNADNNQEIFIKTCCNIWMLMVRALQKGDSKEYASLSEQYAKTFKQAGLKTVEEKDSSNDATFCMTLGLISDYTPEEFYLDKDLYKDNDNIGEYIERHILRPMINLETGNSERDKEFFVPETDEDYEEE